jgi:hypothetical protein
VQALLAAGDLNAAYEYASAYESVGVQRVLAALVAQDRKDPTVARLEACLAAVVVVVVVDAGL